LKIYENITIGNFLFTLGYTIRSKQNSTTLTGSINLLQQTPADKFLGDVLLDFTGVVRLLEFKAQGAHMSKEREKHAVLEIAMRARGLEPISREVHWYVETKASQESLRLRTVPYIDAFPRPREEKIQNLEDLVQSIASDVASQRKPFTTAQIREYLLCVRTANGTSSVGTGGLLLLAEPTGRLQFAVLEDIQELNMRHRLWISEKGKQMEREHQRSLNRDLGEELSPEVPNLSHERSRSYGRSGPRG
jgi:hypothetical protein